MGVGDHDTISSMDRRTLADNGQAPATPRFRRRERRPGEPRAESTLRRRPSKRSPPRDRRGRVPSGKSMRRRYFQAVQQPVDAGGIATRLELPQPHEPRHVGVGRLVEADVHGAVRAEPAPQCELRPGVSASTSASAHSRSIGVAVGRIVLRLPAGVERTCAPSSRFDCASSASSRAPVAELTRRVETSMGHCRHRVTCSITASCHTACSRG